MKELLNMTSEPFTKTSNRLIDSPEYKALSCSARVAYLLLCRQRNHPQKVDVSFPYLKAQQYMAARTWTRAIRELVRSGLIIIKSPGGITQRATVYRLMEFEQPVPDRKGAIYG
jgi:hypothetical protein